MELALASNPSRFRPLFWACSIWPSRRTFQVTAHLTQPASNDISKLGKFGGSNVVVLHFCVDVQAIVMRVH